MSLVKWAFLGLLVLPAAEVAAFLLVAALIGWLWACALLVATSALGIAQLRRAGRTDLDRFLSALARDGIGAVHLETPGMAAVIGGILLVIPGFITDILGAGLLLPPIRRWAGARLAKARNRHRRGGGSHEVIDLEPDEWQRLPDQKRGSAHKPSRPSRAEPKRGSAPRAGPERST